MVYRVFLMIVFCAGLFTVTAYYITTAHIPAVAAWTLAITNFLIASCCAVLPRYLYKESVCGRVGIYIDHEVTSDFRNFIAGCGTHHFTHFPAMWMSMNGFNTGNMTEAWVGYAIMFLVDFSMLLFSARVMISFRKSLNRKINGAYV